MRKKLLFALFFMIIAAAMVIVTIRFMSDEKETGSVQEASDINSEEFFYKNDETNDSVLYDELSRYIYYGEVNYRPLYFAFVRPEDNVSPVYTKYECSVYEIDEEDISYATTTRTRYEVLIDKSGLELKYIEGPQESTYSCEYKNGELTINGTKMEKLDPNDVSITMYQY